MHRKLHYPAMLILFLCIITGTAVGQAPTNLEGVYTANEGGVHQTWILVDGYSSRTTYSDTAFIAAQGGPYIFGGNTMQVDVEFNNTDTAEVGRKKTYQWVAGADGSITVDGLKWHRAVKPQELDGAWHITFHTRDGRLEAIRHEGTRKTLKLLKDGWFQWFAIDPGKKAFYATGGGHYTFQDGQYTEEILFFSRDNSRVGAKLPFQGELKNGAWHHSGLSSKGTPIQEIWER